MSKPITTTSAFWPIIPVFILGLVGGMTFRGGITFHQSPYELRLDEGQRVQLSEGVCGTIVKKP